MNAVDKQPPLLPSLAQGRLYIVLGALLWSTSGAFTKVLTRGTFLHLGNPHVIVLQIAFYRVLFAGLVLLPTLRRRDFSFRCAMIARVSGFATMKGLYVLAIA